MHIDGAPEPGPATGVLRELVQVTGIREYFMFGLAAKKTAPEGGRFALQMLC